MAASPCVDCNSCEVNILRNFRGINNIEHSSSQELQSTHGETAMSQICPTLFDRHEKMLDQ